MILQIDNNNLQCYKLNRIQMMPNTLLLMYCFSFESFADFSDVSKRFNYLYMDMDNYKSCKLGMACMGQHLLGERSIDYLLVF